MLLESRGASLTETFTPQYEGSQESTQNQVDKDTEAKIKEIDEAFEKNQKQVIEKLLQRVTQTKAELHRNLQKQKS